MSDDESGSTIELNRRRVLAGLGTIGVASAGAGAGTMALFSDEESSSSNAVQAGTLDLTAGGDGSFNSSAQNLAPGESTGRVTVSLGNPGTLAGDHVELSVGYGEADGSEPTDTGLSNGISAERFAKRLFVTELQYPTSTNIGLNADEQDEVKNTLLTFTGDRDGAAVMDTGGDGASDIEIIREGPSGGSREDVVHVTSTGTVTNDYAISMRKVSSTDLSDVSTGTIEYDYNPVANSATAVPDEVYVVVNDGGTNRLFYHTGKDNSTIGGGWNTRDVGAEINGNGLDSGRPWFEVTSSGNSAIGTDLADNVSGSIEAVGFGRGSLGGGDTLDIYYDNLVVDGTSYKFRPMSLHDIANRGTFDNLSGIDSGSKTFRANFELDRLAGNDFQGDGVDMTFTFGLAQESGQDVL